LQDCVRADPLPDLNSQNKMDQRGYRFMTITYRLFKTAGIIACFSLALSILAATSTHSEESKTEEYDRLDGTGASGKKVNVIEWEGNLEIHVYPAGSLKSLALKIDKKNKDKPVMIIGYRFSDNPGKQLIRRAILGISLKEGFKTFKDPSTADYDKVIISMNTLSGDMVAYKLEPEPKTLYPEGHPANSSVAGNAPSPASEKRSPASGTTDENGTIKPFNW
jgi:hypothetical protein